MLFLCLWLLQTCQSRNSLLCLLVGVGILFLSRPLLKTTNPKRTLALAAVTLGVLALCDGTLDISGTILEALGRNRTLTGRTAVWESVGKQGTDPIFGFGFCSFWESPKGQNVFDELTQMTEAHNGYLEIYLDGGIVGLGFMAIMLLSAGKRATDRLLGGARFGAMAFAYWVAGLMYNCAESDYFRLGPLWFTFLLMTVAPAHDDYAWPPPEPAAMDNEESVDDLALAS
jgi:O-antigen ligase